MIYDLRLELSTKSAYIGNELRSRRLQTISRKHCTYFHGVECDLQVALLGCVVSVFDQLLTEENSHVRTQNSHISKRWSSWITDNVMKSKLPQQNYITGAAKRLTYLMIIGEYAYEDAIFIC